MHAATATDKLNLCRHQTSVAAGKASKKEAEARAARLSAEKAAAEARATQLEATAGSRLEVVCGEHQREVASLQASLSQEREEKRVLSNRLEKAYFLPAPI